MYLCMCVCWWECKHFLPQTPLKAYNNRCPSPLQKNFFKKNPPTCSETPTTPHPQTQLPIFADKKKKAINRRNIQKTGLWAELIGCRGVSLHFDWLQQCMHAYTQTHAQVSHWGHPWCWKGHDDGLFVARGSTGTGIQQRSLWTCSPTGDAGKQERRTVQGARTIHDTM